MHEGLQSGEPRLGERVPRPEERLLRLQHIQQIGHALPILELGDLERLTGGDRFPLQVIFLLRVMSDLAQRALDVRVGTEYSSHARAHTRVSGGSRIGHHRASCNLK